MSAGPSSFTDRVIHDRRACRRNPGLRAEAIDRGTAPGIRPGVSEERGRLQSARATAAMRVGRRGPPGGMGVHGTPRRVRLAMVERTSHPGCCGRAKRGGRAAWSRRRCRIVRGHHRSRRPRAALRRSLSGSPFRARVSPANIDDLVAVMAPPRRHRSGTRGCSPPPGRIVQPRPARGCRAASRAAATGAARTPATAARAGFCARTRIPRSTCTSGPTGSWHRSSRTRSEASRD